MSRLINLAALGALICALSASCGPDSGAASAQADANPAAAATPAFAAGFPAPSTLPRSASAPSDDDRLKAGGDYDLLLPSANVASGEALGKAVSGTDPLALFQPQYTQGLSGPGDAAYATWRFSNMADISGSMRVKAFWDLAPAGGDCYFALANFGRDSWDWYRPGPQGNVALASFEPYISDDGSMLVLVIVLGSADANLRWLLVGPNVPPTLSLSSDLDADPAQNLAPRSVHFTASPASSIAQIVSLDFDLDGQPGYEVLNDADYEADFSYDAPGLYTARARATDSNGEATERELQFTIIDPANTPPTAALAADINNGAAPLKVVLDASASSDDGSIIRHEWDYDNDGTYDIETGADPFYEHIFGNKGAVDVQVRVTDNDYATATASYTITLSAGWQTVLIDDVPLPERPLAMSTSGVGAGERACVAYQASGSALKFCRASMQDGSAWSAPVTIQAGSDSGHGVSMLRSPASGFPLVAYGLNGAEYYDYTLYVRAALGESGALWGPPVQVSGSEKAGMYNKLGVFDGKPGVASIAMFGNTGNDQVYYYNATDAAGTLWGAAQSALEPVAGRKLMSMDLIGVDGCPFIGACYYGASSLETRLYATANPDGGGWGGFVDLAGLTASFVSLRDTGGFPALASGGFTTAPESRLRYLRSGDTNGLDWSAEPQELSASPQGQWPRLVLNGMLPVVFFYGQQGQDLWITEALDVSGDAWSEPYRIATIGNSGEYADAVYVNGNPVVCYYLHDQTALWAAWLDN